MLTDDDDKGDSSSIAATNTVVTTTSSTTNASISTEAPVKKEVKLITRVTELLKAGCGGGILAESTSINEEFNHTRICMGLHSGLNILKSSVMTTADNKDSNDGADGNDDAEYDLLLHPGDMMTLRKCNGNLGIVLVPIEEKKIDDEVDRMMMKKKMGDNVDAVKRDGVDSRKNNSESKDKGDDNNKTDQKNGKVIGGNDTTIAVATGLNTGKDDDNTDDIGESKKDDDRKENNVSAKNNEVNIKDNINDISSNNNNNNNNISSNNRNNIENGVTNNNENIMETSKDKADSIKNIEVVKKKLRSEVQCFGAKVPRGEWTHLAFIATTTPNNRFTLYMVCQLVYK